MRALFSAPGGSRLPRSIAASCRCCQVGLEVSWRELDRALTALHDGQVIGKVVLRID